jgi:REP element-mobilizing transposase RayT
VRYDPEKLHRRSIRLRGYDYTQPGAYFVTIVTRNRECLFGDVVGENMALNEYGRIVHACWKTIPDHFPNVTLDAFVVMPNHVHGIIVIDFLGATHAIAIVGARHASPLQITQRHAFPPPDATSTPCGPKRRSIGAIVGSFKSAVTKRINEMRGTPGVTIWQRNYYEHIIRSEESLNRIREYILRNPSRWDLDRENPAARSADKRRGMPWEI